MKKSLVVAVVACWLGLNVLPVEAVPGRGGGGGARGGFSGGNRDGGSSGGGREGSRDGGGVGGRDGGNPGGGFNLPGGGFGGDNRGGQAGDRVNPRGDDRFNNGFGTDRRNDNVNVGDRPNNDQINRFLNNPGTDNNVRRDATDPRSQWNTQNNQWTRNVQNNVNTQVNVAARNAFTPDWYKANPHGWQQRYPHADAYAAASWTSAAAWLGIAAAPVAYGYPTGGTTLYNNNNYTSTGSTPDSQYAVTPDPVEQSQTSAALAQTGRNANIGNNTQWLPLGVFALVPGQEKSSNQLVQLQLSKEGILAGSYLDMLSNNTSPVQGAVDKQSQRAGWSIGDNRNVTFDTALSNLTQDSAPLIVRFGDNSQQNWTLVRMPSQSSGN